MITLTTSLTRAQRARENSAQVRRLLSTRQPTFAAALAAAERDFRCAACPSKRLEMIARRPGESRRRTAE
jgi:hypothetical protein